MLRNTEKAITATIVKTAIEQGYLVSAGAGESADCDLTDDLQTVLDAAFSYDCVNLELDPNGNKKLNSGWISLDFFEDGKNIISNYSMGIEDFVKSLNYKKVELNLIDL